MTTPDDLQKEIEAMRPTGPKKSPARDPREGMGAGLQMAVSIFVCAWIGYSIDQMADSAPWGLIILLLLGVASGFYAVYKASKGL